MDLVGPDDLVDVLGDLDFHRVTEMPRPPTPMSRRASTEAMLSEIHASAARVVLVVAPDESGEVIVAVGRPSPDAAPAETADVSRIATAEVVHALADLPAWAVFVPSVRLDVDWQPAGPESADVLDQMRLLEDLRRPGATAVAIEGVPLDQLEVEQRLVRTMNDFSPAVAGGSPEPIGFDEWKQHHIAMGTTSEMGVGRSSAVWSMRVRIGGSDAGHIARAVSTINQSLALSTRFELVAAHPGDPAPAALGTNAVISAVGFPPIAEMAGFRTPSVWFFDQTQERSTNRPAPHDSHASTVDAHAPAPAEHESWLTLASILSPTGSTGAEFQLGSQNLVRHTLVTGATGSGKTETVKRLVDGLRCPWLIIEPAKSEYRYVRFGPDRDQAPLSIRPGDPLSPPLQLNPLEPHPGFPLRTHVDLVLALFLAAFDPIDPLPQILAAALDRTYEEASWLVPLNRMAGRSESEAPTSRDYPRLADLQRAARDVVKDIGYGKEANDTVRGFVDVRLGSLRRGTAGRLFENGHPTDVAALMDQRVVIELDDMGNDQEKSFVMGVVLVRVYEYLRCAMDAQRRKGVFSRPLSHVTIIEEAHRLLRAPTSGEKPNFAIETFANMLAELRSYGEGLIIVEQVPSKIIPDAVKNTGTKVLHRLPSVDDRQFAGGSANIAVEQLAALGALRPGQAIAFTDEMDRPAHVQVERVPAVSVAEPPPADLSLITDDRDPMCLSSTHLCTMTELVLGESSAGDAGLVGLWLELLWPGLAAGHSRVRPPSPGLLDRWQAITPCGWCRLVNDSVDIRRGLLVRWAPRSPGEIAARLHEYMIDLGSRLAAGELDDAAKLMPDILGGEIPVAVQAAIGRGMGEPIRAVTVASPLRRSHSTPELLGRALWRSTAHETYLVNHLPGFFASSSGTAAGDVESDRAESDK